MADLLGVSQTSPTGSLSISTIASKGRKGRIATVGPPGPKEQRWQRRPFLCRKEVRIPMKMYVNLYSLDNPTFEVAPTIDISCHGARVVTKTIWQPNQQISVRSIRGNLYSPARVVYCQPYMDKFSVIGIEIYSSTGGWTKPSR